MASEGSARDKEERLSVGVSSPNAVTRCAGGHTRSCHMAGRLTYTQTWPRTPTTKLCLLEAGKGTRQPERLLITSRN